MEDARGGSSVTERVATAGRARDAREIAFVQDIPSPE
jgi:hypothetical protein